MDSSHFFYRWANLLGALRFSSDTCPFQGIIYDDSEKDLCHLAHWGCSRKGTELKMRVWDELFDVLRCTCNSSPHFWTVASATSVHLLVISFGFLMRYFLDPVPLILGLFHPNPQQPLWGTLDCMMSRGYTRISLDLNGAWTRAHALGHCFPCRVKECPYTPFLLCFSLRQHALFFIRS
jgi:hypothetical protein